MGAMLSAGGEGATREGKESGARWKRIKRGLFEGFKRPSSSTEPKFPTK